MVFCLSWWLNISDFIIDSWWFEVVKCCFSICKLVLIVLIGMFWVGLVLFLLRLGVLLKLNLLFFSLFIWVSCLFRVLRWVVCVCSLFICVVSVLIWVWVFFWVCVSLCFCWVILVWRWELLNMLLLILVLKLIR